MTSGSICLTCCDCVWHFMLVRASVRVQALLCWANVHGTDSSTEHSSLLALPSTCLGVTVYQPGSSQMREGKIENDAHKILVLILVAITLNYWHVKREAHIPKSEVVCSWLLVQGGEGLRSGQWNAGAWCTWHQQQRNIHFQYSGIIFATAPIISMRYS